MPFLHSYTFYIIMAFVTAFVITFIAIPSVISVAKKKHLFDEPGARKSHTSSIPTLGGVAIFGGFIIALSIWGNMAENSLLQYVLAASCIIFLVGAKDDIIDLDPYKKFLGQIVATFVLVIMADLRFYSFHDLFPIGELPYLVSIFISAFTILVITNAFNLIDGINGLSATQGIIVSLAFGTWFYFAEEYQLVVLVAALIGALVAFLRFNVSPAAIFMGDTGSLLIGLISATLAIVFANSTLDPMHGIHVNAAPAIAIGFLALPLFDLLRAFSIRISKGKSPFNPDKIHLHHMLLDTGCSHMKATFLLALVQISCIVFVLFLQQFIHSSWLIIAILLGYLTLLAQVLFITKRNHKRKHSR